MSQITRLILTSATLFASLFLAALPAAAVPVPERWKAGLPLEPIWVRVAFHGDEPPETPGVAITHLEECVDGDAGGFACDHVDLWELVPLAAMGATAGNDIWGWTDPATGREYALMGLNNGTAFVDISDPGEPVLVGTLPTQTVSSIWRDIKVYADHAFIVSEAPGHGLQVFDLTELRAVATPPVTFSPTVHYDGFGKAHNVVINESSGFAYAVGTDTCAAGLHMIDVGDPTHPAAAGCFSADGYTHDAQCVDYAGPDGDHAGKEICFASNEDTLTIVGVTDKGAPVQLSRTGYSGSAYTHQGWLTEDHSYFLLDDEGDESSHGHNTRTYVWDVRDLDAPVVIGTHDAATPNTDHNQYVLGDYVYQANYGAGLRILRLDDVAAGNLTEVAFFDTSSAWSVYPYFESGTVVVSDIDLGLFVLRPQLCSTPAAPSALAAAPGGDQLIDLSWSGSALDTTVDVYRSFGTCPGDSFELVASGVVGTAYSDPVSGQVDYAYTVTAVDATGLCESEASNCASASTTGDCTAPPIFAGLDSVANPAGATCALVLSWHEATPNCGAGVSYSVYKSTEADFVPGPENRVAAGLESTTWLDADVVDGETYAYVVRATDLGSGTEDGNRVVRTGRPTGPLGDGTFTAGAEPGDPFLPTYNGTANAAAGVKNHVGWELSTARRHSGERSYFSTYVDGMCSSLATLPLGLTAGESSQLRFWTVYDVEPAFDGGVVQISDDGGSSWQQLDLTPGYPGSFNGSSNACGFGSGTPSFTGTDLVWTEYTADLSPYNGGEVEIRWTFSTDGGLTLEGWYVDDVAITHAQVPGVCVDASVLFLDGFESGDTSAWSLSSP